MPSKFAFLAGVSALVVMPATVVAQPAANYTVEDVVATYGNRPQAPVAEGQQAALAADEAQDEGLDDTVGDIPAEAALTATTVPAEDCLRDEIDPEECVVPVGRTRGFELSEDGSTQPVASSSATRRRAPADNARQTVRRTRGGTAPRRAPAVVSPQRRNGATEIAPSGIIDNNMLITFASDSSTLTEQGLANVRVFAEALNRPDMLNVRLLIEGHTDAFGDAAYNQALSERRAQAVRQALIEAGVDPARLETVGLGETQLFNADDPNGPENRRVVAKRVGGE